MRLCRPRSVLGLVLIGFSLVALPLLIAVVSAGLYVDKLAESSQRLVVQGVRVTRINERLSETITDMERYVRQYYVVGEPALWDLYLDNKATFHQILENLHAIDRERLMSGEIAELQRLGDLLPHILPTVSAEPENTTPDAPTKMITRFSRLHRLAQNITRNSNAFIDTEVESLDEEASVARKRLLWQSATLVPITILLAAIFSVLIARPIRRLSSAISHLGEGKFSDPIAVTGPPELRALGTRLDWLRERLLEADQSKNMFLRHMSHELKTPLASLREGTELLTDGSVGRLTKTQSEVAEILHGNCLQLQTLIENLLDFSAWQQDALRLNVSHFNIGTLIDTIVDQHQLEIDRKKLSIEVRATTIELSADRPKLRTAIDNLFANAVKFSPQFGRIVIAITTDGQQARLDVYDDGPGVASAEQDLVFEPFYQGSSDAGTSVRGTGIGLSVVRECARAHQGKVEVMEVSRGGHFRLSLPIHAAGGQHV